MYFWYLWYRVADSSAPVTAGQVSPTQLLAGRAGAIVTVVGLGEKDYSE